MPAPNDLVYIAFTGTGAGSSISFKPSQFRAAYISTVSTENFVDLFLSDSLNGITLGSPTIRIPQTDGATWTVADAQQGVEDIYNAVDAYYTAINS
jgi:hypothetical protein